jgi:hypothetical protein
MNANVKKIYINMLGEWQMIRKVSFSRRRVGVMVREVNKRLISNYSAVV